MPPRLLDNGVGVGFEKAAASASKRVEQLSSAVHSSAAPAALSSAGLPSGADALLAPSVESAASEGSSAQAAKPAPPPSDDGKEQPPLDHSARQHRRHRRRSADKRVPLNDEPADGDDLGMDPSVRFTVFVPSSTRSREPPSGECAFCS